MYSILVRCSIYHIHYDHQIKFISSGVQILYFHSGVLASWSNNYILKCYMIAYLSIFSCNYVIFLFLPYFLATLFTDAWNPFICLYRLHYFLNWPIFSFLFTSICLLAEAFSPFLYLLKYWLRKLILDSNLPCFVLSIGPTCSFFFLWVYYFPAISSSTRLEFLSLFFW